MLLRSLPLGPCTRRYITVFLAVVVVIVCWTLFGLITTIKRSSIPGLTVLSNYKSSEHDTKTNDKSKADQSSSYEEKVDKIQSFAEMNCPTYNERMTNVHFILHSHDDPGWLVTPEQYYEDDVRHILNNVIEQLVKESHRKFTYSEMYFFSKWWNSLDESMKDTVKTLVQQGRLEFTGGGWVQNDDASTHYTAAIDQLTYGWSKIDSYFGQNALPKTGWHVDNFGYSQEQAHIFQQIGMDYNVICRLHHLDIVKRRESKLMEFLWRTSSDTELFTHVLYDHYISPAEFCFESTTRDNGIRDSNEQEKTEGLLELLKHRAQAYQTNHLFFILGMDVAFKNASVWFEPLDRLIQLGNMKQSTGSNVQLFYSTPSCYFKAAQEAASLNKLTWPTYDGDFYPYATSSGSYWTGYFSSRTPLKRNIRTAQNLAASVISSEVEANLNVSREALYTTLHHDGITGTCKQKVADQYLRLTLMSISSSQEVLNSVITTLAGFADKPSFGYCPLINISVCPYSTGRDEFTVVVINGFSHDRSSFIRIPVDDGQYELTNGEGHQVPLQITPVTDESKQFGRLKGRSDLELGFFASLPALGFATFKIRKVPQTIDDEEDNANENMNPEEIYIENEFFTLEFDGSGRVAFIIDKKSNSGRKRLVQDFFWHSNDNSGAYILRPDELHNVTGHNVRITRIERGPLVQEVRQVFAGWITQIIRLYKDKPYVEFEWTVGPLEPGNEGKEVITRFSTDLKTDRMFYTDVNGRRFVKRIRDPMDSYYILASSFYPITAAVALQDGKTQLTLVTDRSLGASSTTSGSLELIVYRKVMYDDGLGMGEGLDERDANNRGIVVRGKIWLTLGPVEEADVQWRYLAKEMFYEPILAFPQSTTQWPNKFSVLQQPLPPPIHLLTLQRSSRNSCLIRFEHIYSTDPAQKDRPISVQFRDLFHGVNLKKCRETQLGGFNKNTKFTRVGFVAKISPMSIVTYKCLCQ